MAKNKEILIRVNGKYYYQAGKVSEAQHILLCQAIKEGNTNLNRIKNDLDWKDHKTLRMIRDKEDNICRNKVDELGEWFQKNL